jgi:hypothetical protein
VWWQRIVIFDFHESRAGSDDGCKYFSKQLFSRRTLNHQRNATCR